jgi:hypothetical protein
LAQFGRERGCFDPSGGYRANEISLVHELPIPIYLNWNRESKDMLADRYRTELLAIMAGGLEDPISYTVAKAILPNTQRV